MILSFLINMFINFLEKYQCFSKIEDFSSKSGENQSSALVDLPVLKGHDAKGMEQLCQDTVFVHPFLSQNSACREIWW